MRSVNGASGEKRVLFTCHSGPVHMGRKSEMSCGELERTFFGFGACS